MNPPREIKEETKNEHPSVGYDMWEGVTTGFF